MRPILLLLRLRKVLLEPGDELLQVGSQGPRQFLLLLCTFHVVINVSVDPPDLES
jgi:hypothetical protein